MLEVKWMFLPEFFFFLSSCIVQAVRFFLNLWLPLLPSRVAKFPTKRSLEEGNYKKTVSWLWWSLIFLLKWRFKVREPNKNQNRTNSSKCRPLNWDEQCLTLNLKERWNRMPRASQKTGQLSLLKQNRFLLPSSISFGPVFHSSPCCLLPYLSLTSNILNLKLFLEQGTHTDIHIPTNSIRKPSLTMPLLRLFSSLYLVSWKPGVWERKQLGVLTIYSSPSISTWHWFQDPRPTPTLIGYQMQGCSSPSTERRSICI